MTVLAADPSARFVPAPLLVLAAAESRRLALHPVTLVGWAIFLFSAVREVLVTSGPRPAYESVEMLVSFYPGVLLLLAGQLIASRDHRAGADELLGAVPVRADRRTAAVLLAALPQAMLGVIVVLLVHGAHLLRGNYQAAPGAEMILQGPITLAGAVCLGVMVARWSTSRAAILVVIVAMVLVNAWLNNLTTGAYFGPMFNWAQWGVSSADWAGIFRGSPLWRLGYLGGLVALAALGALLPVVRRPQLIVVLGLVVLVWTGISGWSMLP